MNEEVFLLQPEPGQVVQISKRHGRCDFVIGYCRGVLQVGRFVRFLEGFHRCSDPAMTTTWHEPHDFGIQPLRQLSFTITPEAPWMIEGTPGRTK